VEAIAAMRAHLAAACRVSVLVPAFRCPIICSSNRCASAISFISSPVFQRGSDLFGKSLASISCPSERNQVVMENLLNYVVQSGAEIAMMDITGFPIVDTLVAQHLIKTVSAARLMGADCVISGIRPQIAQTIVHLGCCFEGNHGRRFRAGAERTEKVVRRLAKLRQPRQVIEAIQNREACCADRSAPARAH